LAQARNPYSRSWLWILRCAIAHRSSRCARPGMTTEGIWHTHTPPHSRDAIRPSHANSFAPQEIRGRREDRVRAAPAVSCATCTKNAHEHTGSAEASRPSLRNGFTAYFVLSLATGFLATIIPEKRLLLEELDASVGASEPHDFAVRKCAVRLRARARPAPSRPPHPAPRSRRS
jgi:hypothetical protein